MPTIGTLGFYIDNRNTQSEQLVFGAVKYLDVARSGNRLLFSNNLDMPIPFCFFGTKSKPFTIDDSCLANGLKKSNIPRHKTFDRVLKKLGQASDNALFICGGSRSLFEKIARLRIPSIFYADWLSDTEPLEGDDRIIRIVPDYACAASTILSDFFQSGLYQFGFFGDETQISTCRFRDEFTRCAHQKNVSVQICNISAAGQDLTERLEESRKGTGPYRDKSLKPIGIMAPNDLSGVRLLEIIRMKKIALVPQEIAVTGVGNDSFLCKINQPTLSSLDLNYQQAGFEALENLNQMINGRPFQRIVRINPLWVVARHSTEIFSSNPKVRQAQIFIRKTPEANVNDVVRQIGTSRRFLEKHFLDEFGHTVLEEIQNRRLKRIQQLLVLTDLPIREISVQLGFSRPAYLSTVFQKAFGMSPIEYRRQNCFKQ